MGLGRGRAVDADQHDDEGDGVHGSRCRAGLRRPVRSIVIPAAPLRRARVRAWLGLWFFNLLLLLCGRWLGNWRRGVHAYKEGDEGDGVHGLVGVAQLRSEPPRPSPSFPPLVWPCSWAGLVRSFTVSCFCACAGMLGALALMPMRKAMKAMGFMVTGVGLFYGTKVEYRRGGRHTMWMVHPANRAASGRSVEHVQAQGPLPCCSQDRSPVRAATNDGLFTTARQPPMHRDQWH